jgi:hypothetical protein
LYNLSEVVGVAMAASFYMTDAHEEDLIRQPIFEIDLGNSAILDTSQMLYVA